MTWISSFHPLQPAVRRHVSALIAAVEKGTSVYRHCIGVVEAVIQDQPRCTKKDTLVEITNVL